ncbi:MAG: heavy-metal-associated domain-containing protein [Bacteroidaceae bacterium]|nr:heavy-metal-associated domain-containing protein [Bacteroidaceae bacterium]
MVYTVKGMSCNHCKASVEKAISGVEGVEKVEVDLTKGIAYVEGKHDIQAALDAVNAIGFNISVSENN